MDRVTKEAQVNELKDKLGRVASIVLADYRGIDVPIVTGLRDEFRKVSATTRCSRTRSSRSRSRAPRWSGCRKLLEGPTAMIFSYESPSAPAKVATKFAKDQEKFVIKGGYFDGRSSTPRASRGSRRCRARTSCGRSCSRPSWRRRRTSCARFAAGAQNFVYLLTAKERRRRRRLSNRNGEGQWPT